MSFQASNDTQFSSRVRALHHSLRTLQPDLSRIGVALYNPVSGMIQTYGFSSDEPNPLRHYSVPLATVPSLVKLAQSRTPRLLQNLDIFQDNGQAHTRTITEAGYHSSFTVPMHQGDDLVGFVFFDSTRVNGFKDYVLPQLEIAAYAISLLVINENRALKTLEATMKSVVEVTRHRNPETGDHLKRIASYSRIIAESLAPTMNLSEAFVEHVILFSSMHDIGKISIPDSVLLKPEELTAEEFEIMKLHTVRGRSLVDTLIKNHSLESTDFINVLRNIIELHHESWDGSGYPHGMKATDIPLEARIVAVADVYDALTGERPYKNRLSDPHAFTILKEMAGNKLDPDCVSAFLTQRNQVIEIRNQFLPDIN